MYGNCGYYYNFIIYRSMNKIHEMEVTMDKAEATAYKAKRGVRRIVRHWKAKVLAVLLGVSLSLLMLFVAFYNMSQWYDKNKVEFQTPVIIRDLIVISERKTQLATSSAIIEIKPITDQYLPILNELYRKIEFKESNNGMNRKDPDDLHNYCQRIGKVNNIGWRPSENIRLHINFCFADYGEQWATFKEVFAERLKTMTINEAVCLHNTGKKQPMCNYSMELDTVK